MKLRLEDSGSRTLPHQPIPHCLPAWLVKRQIPRIWISKPIHSFIILKREQCSRWFLMFLCIGFLFCRLKIEWPAEWDTILRWLLFRRVSETTPLEKQGQEQHSGETAKGKRLSTVIASIGLWHPQSQSAPASGADWPRGNPLNTPQKDKTQEWR